MTSNINQSQRAVQITGSAIPEISQAECLREGIARDSLMKNHRVVLLGPSRDAVSGVSTHLNQLFESSLVDDYRLLHFQVGSEGRKETRGRRMLRIVGDPLALTLLLRRERPDIVHVNTSLEPRSYWRDIVYVMVAKLMGCKVVYQVHGGALPLEFFRGNQPLTALLRRVLETVDRVVLLAQAEVAAYRSFAPLARVEIVPNAINTKEMVLRAEGRDSYEPLHLIYVGRLAATKGIFEIIEALAILKRRGHRLKLSIVGGGPEELTLREAVERSGVAQMVEFRGPLFGEEKNALWRAAHVFVFPTYHREGLPYALLEGMASGAVPVVSPVGAIPDVMQDGVHGLFVPAKNPVVLAEAIACLDVDRSRLQLMAKAGQERIRTYYTIDRLSDDFNRLYSGL